MTNNIIIIIEDGLSLKQERGVGQYTKRLYEILKNDYSVVEMARKFSLENINNNLIRRILYILWLNTIFVFKLLTIKDNVICFFPATITPFIKFKKVKYISVIHDIRSVEYPGLSTKVQNIHANFANWSALKFADKVITVSNTMKEAIKRYYRIDDSKLSVVYNISSIQNIKYDSQEQILQKLGVQPKSYLLFVGGQDKNKNIKTIISVFEYINTLYPEIKLVIVGSKGNDHLHNLKLNSHIIFTGFISNEDIKVLYKNAYVYLFPSLYEGFGIPILDAQTMEIPIICSDIPVFREVAGDGALFAIPDVEDFSLKLKNLLNNLDLQEILKRRGIDNLQRFQMQIVEKQLEAIIK